MQQEEEKIELELPEGEVDIREADVDDNIVDEPEQETEVVETKDELDSISDSVQKRIDKLTYKMREAERQRDEAVTFAESLNTANSDLKSKLKSSDSSLFKEYENRIQSDLERAKIELREANEAQNAEAITTATENLSRAAAEAENFRRLSAQQQLREESESKVEEYTAPQQYSQPQAQPDPKAEEWASKNKWFGEDQTMTFTAFGLHKELVDSGIDPQSNEYYEKIDSGMRDIYPNKFSEEQPKPVQQVAASSRGASGRKASRKVKLTPSQVAIAKRLNVPLEEYAKHIEKGV
tara:strand:+ start:3742 stop:4623 length:882 start_codon:yes stop_codon:yes gene_type:complete